MQKRLENVFQKIGSPGAIYGQKTLYNIPRNFDNLAQMHIKVYLSTGSVASTEEAALSTRIFQSIVLRTKSGTILQTLDPNIILARLDELSGTSLATQIAPGLVSSPTLNSIVTTIATCYVPLFFFFSDSMLSFLKTRNLEPLELECTVNTDKDAMGLSVDLTSISHQLYLVYHDVNSSNKVSDLIDSVKPVAIENLYGSFDTFKEDPLLLLTGATSARLLLRCPHPLFVLHMALVTSISQRAQIKTMTLTSSNNVIATLDYRMNYAVYSDSSSFVDSGTLSYWFSKEKLRSTDSGLVTFSGSFFPCYLDVTFDALAADTTLYVFEEYRTNFNVSPKGTIHLSNDSSLMDQSNSSTSQAYLTGV